MNTEQGSITLWMVGMVMIVLAVGGIAVDLWRGLNAHRQVAAIADAAAVAAGSGVDEEEWRSDGVLRLDPARVEARVRDSVAAQDQSVVDGYQVTTAPDGSTATVLVTGSVDLTLLSLLVDGDLTVSARAVASPLLQP